MAIYRTSDFCSKTAHIFISIIATLWPKALGIEPCGMTGNCLLSSRDIYQVCFENGDWWWLVLLKVCGLGVSYVGWVWMGLGGVGERCQLPRSPSPGFRWHPSSTLSTFLLNWYCTRVVLIESRPIYVYQQIHCCWLCWKILLSSVLWIGILSRLPDLRHSDGKYKQQYKRTSVQSRNHWGATEWIRKRWTYC